MNYDGHHDASLAEGAAARRRKRFGPPAMTRSDTQAAGTEHSSRLGMPRHSLAAAAGGGVGSGLVFGITGVRVTASGSPLPDNLNAAASLSAGPIMPATPRRPRSKLQNMCNI